MIIFLDMHTDNNKGGEVRESPVNNVSPDDYPDPND